MALQVDDAVAGEAPGRPDQAGRGAPRRAGAARRWFEIALLAFLAVVMLFPVVWMLETSLKENRDVYAVPAKLLGFDVTFDHYKDVFVQRGGSGASDLATNFKNSVLVAGLSTVLATLLGVPAAWAYSRFPIKLKKDQLFFILSTRFMPPVVVVIPIFLMYRDLGLIDTKLGLILIYTAFNLPFTIWMMKGFVDEVPGEYEDAAMLDGYSRLDAFFRVTLPLLVPGIAATAVFALIFSWNEFVLAIFLTSSESARTAPPAIAGLIGGTTIDWGLVAASAMVFAAPVLLFAFLVRKHLVAGVTLGGGPALMARIEITGLQKRFPDGTVAVEQLDLAIGDGELFVMLGPSGCGKTTTLRAIAGLERQTGGHIDIGDVRVDDLPPAERDIAMVFQFYALYPHLRTRDNIAFPLRAEGLPDDEVDRRVAEAARMLQLEPLLTRRPSRLSGGEQQRVALARALVRQPEAFLMDEPLTNLDAEIRADMRTEIKHLQARLGTTMVYVTHDQLEAMSLGNRIAILNQGRLEQVGTPMEVYDRPATLFCARFIGSPPMNLVPVEVADGALRGTGGLALRPPDGLARGRAVVAGVRPEALELVAPAEDAVPARVVSEEALGDEVIYVVEAGGQDLRVRMPPASRFEAGSAVGLRHTGGPPPVYDPQTELVVA